MAKYLFLLCFISVFVWSQETVDVSNEPPEKERVIENSSQTSEASEQVINPEEVLPDLAATNFEEASENIPLPEVEETKKSEEKIKEEEDETDKAVVGGTLEEEKAERQVKRILYKWNPPQGVDVKYYIIEAYADNQLKKRIKKGKARKNQIVIKLFEDEVLYIRIATKAKNGLISDFSNLSKVVYDPKIELKEKKKLPYAFGLFYAVSTGSFTETVSTGDEASLDQNSPLTVGITSSYKFDPDWTLYSSAYISYFSEAEIPRSGNSTAETPPLEIGINSYAQSKWKLLGIEGLYYYAGLDFEIFQTFNTKDFASGDPLEFRAQNILYLTVGFQKNFTMLKRFSFVKFSLSPTILSSGSDNANGESYTGLKYIFYLHHTLKNRWGTGFFLKQHVLSGAGDLTVTRYGINVSYRLF